VRQRTISSVGVVIVGLVPAFMGGPVWAGALTILFAIGAQEYYALARRISGRTRSFGVPLVPAFALVAAVGGREPALLGVVALAIGLPFLDVILRDDLQGAFVEWAMAGAGAIYLGVPIFSAITLRRMDGAIDAAWLADVADWASLGWDDAPRGLAWLLVVILVTWLSDSGAYLVGRSYGRRSLIPVVSPKKTVEGLIGGLASAALTGAVAVALFGLGVSPALGLLLGIVLGVVGVLGDLAVSVLKRQAGVKDSGTLIPGHGGMLDRLDALLFTFPAGWFLALLIDRTLR
jgi:phosphatidate cytidylyltransferase